MSARDDLPPAAPQGAEPPRLLDDPGDRERDATGAWAMQLLRGTEPYRTPAGRKQRVQLRLGHVPRRRAPVLLRFAVAASVLCGSAAIVRAAMGHWPDWVARAYDRVIGARPAASTPARAHAARHAHDGRPAVPPAAPVADDVPWPEVPIEPIADASTPRPVRTAARPPRAVLPPAPVAAEDASAVSAAMRALRVEHDPVRARGLLARYLAEHPNGNLAEEALALSIEAALAHHDTDAGGLANRYLRLYPQGAFAGLAQRALADQ
jgi:hypothetical protein